MSGEHYTAFKIARETALYELGYDIDNTVTKIVEDMRK